MGVYVLGYFRRFGGFLLYGWFSIIILAMIISFVVFCFAVFVSCTKLPRRACMFLTILIIRSLWFLPWLEGISILK